MFQVKLLCSIMAWEHWLLLHQLSTMKKALSSILTVRSEKFRHKLYSQMNVAVARLMVTKLRLREQRSCLTVNCNRIKVLSLAVTVKRLIRASSLHHNWIKIRAIESWAPPGNCLFSFHAPRHLEAVIKLSLEHRDLCGDLDKNPLLNNLSLKYVNLLALQVLY